jgi:hypothetical protein
LLKNLFVFNQEELMITSLAVQSPTPDPSPSPDPAEVLPIFYAVGHLVNRNVTATTQNIPQSNIVNEVALSVLDGQEELSGNPCPGIGRFCLWIVTGVVSSSIIWVPGVVIWSSGNTQEDVTMGKQLSLAGGIVGIAGAVIGHYCSSMV